MIFYLYIENPFITDYDMNPDTLFEKLWSDYSSMNPSVQKIHDLFDKEGEEIVNDHIAFRTLDYKAIDIDVIAKAFTPYGYVSKGEYFLSDKHLYARHFENPGLQNAPRVFISQLVLNDCPDFIRETFDILMDRVNSGSLTPQELITSGTLFPSLSFDLYNRLRKESEYAAWFYVFGFRANHFTVSVNSLKKYRSIEEVNELLKRNGFILNTSGGEVKGTVQEMLQQSSTMADIVKVEFEEGTFEVPSCYYEFAHRHMGKDGRLFSGFIAGSADKIFESTDFFKKK
jgi:hypothetical protein